MAMVVETIVKAEAMDGSGTNNANFSTPTGKCTVCKMYLWTNSNPDRDASFDNGVIVHEYGHGVSNRLTGGPANSSCLNNIQSGGMGEGWSDYFGLMLTMEPGDNGANARGIGTYLLGQTPSGAGIRRKQYSTDMIIDPLELALMELQAQLLMELHESHKCITRRNLVVHLGQELEFN
jgi:hypothetical protein